MDNKDFDTFDFLINDEDEVMLLLYQREGEPLNPHIELDAEEKSALLYRNDDDNIFLSDSEIPPSCAFAWESAASAACSSASSSAVNERAVVAIC